MSETKGEHGIQILAPAGHADATVDADGNETPGRPFFKLAYVFDISQTDPAEELVAV